MFFGKEMFSRITLKSTASICCIIKYIYLVAYSYFLINVCVYNCNYFRHLFINEPQSLVARLFKARYYTNTHFLKSTKGAGSSFLWSGIHNAKETLFRGYRWVVGDGTDIIATKDPWLRNKNDFHVEQSHIYVGRNENVSHWFEPGTKSWDADRVKAYFHEEDAKAILAVPVPQRDARDRVAWVDSIDGQYSVKTGYKHWLKQHGENINVVQSEGWKKIWKLELPHKVRVFLWRFCRNNIPVRIRLRSKGVRPPVICPMCNVDVEHVLHLFFDCPFATQCWNHMGVSYDMHDVTYAPDWLLQKLGTGSKAELTKIATVLWGVWCWRNNRVWEDKHEPPGIAMEWSQRVVADWQKANRNISSRSTNQDRYCFSTMETSGNGVC